MVGGTECCICSKPHAFSSLVGSQRSSVVGIFLCGGISLPGLTNDPCKYCSPRLIAGFKALDPQERHVWRVIRCMNSPIKSRSVPRGGDRRGTTNRPARTL